MSDRYFFDKREWKRRFIKYIIIFLISFLPLVFFNIGFSKYLKSRWLVIFLDCVILLLFVWIGNIIAAKIYEKKDKKLERLRKQREEIEAQKIKIMEDSYAKKRQEKAKSKQAKLDTVVVVENSEKNKSSKESKNRSRGK